MFMCSDLVFTNKNDARGAVEWSDRFSFFPYLWNFGRAVERWTWEPDDVYFTASFSSENGNYSPFTEESIFFAVRLECWGSEELSINSSYSSQQLGSLKINKTIECIWNKSRSASHGWFRSFSKTGLRCRSEVHVLVHKDMHCMLLFNSIQSNTPSKL
jgi:hypothetical protein